MAQLVKHLFVHHEENPQELIAPVVDEQALDLLKKEAFAQGYQEALHAIEQQQQDIQQQLRTLINSIPSIIAQHRNDLSQEITSLCLLIMQQYFVAQSLDPKILEEQINQMLRELNEQQQIELQLHPKDLHALQAGQILLQQNKQLNIKSNEQLRLGGFAIKTEHGLFDASIEKQIDRLKRYLLSHYQGEGTCTR